MKHQNKMRAVIFAVLISVLSGLGPCYSEDSSLASSLELILKETRELRQTSYEVSREWDKEKSGMEESLLGLKAELESVQMRLRERQEKLKKLQSERDSMQAELSKESKRSGEFAPRLQVFAKTLAGGLKSYGLPDTEGMARRSELTRSTEEGIGGKAADFLAMWDMLRIEISASRRVQYSKGIMQHPVKGEIAAEFLRYGSLTCFYRVGGDDTVEVGHYDRDKHQWIADHENPSQQDIRDAFDIHLKKKEARILLISSDGMKAQP